ncbi:hypothetical protein SPRG_12983 [Saprolegnia parasitica CBS 223.65]|uniref:Uncharacterized protein n=1 Tax=Saprolegnia parasitica (strain CBS 223.65) TaxID=695850 RepID=A0A067C245_SAPPC|nr:hypothetical protein SPRG_12983 [Saprolegnia parasitica CBS 223.65]KDO20626.1 hypothetical protein SPRG_12983 [Saprolegnia parasitica CBS 223.65]|eukprot:XP_012208680.1 hypothetical protein SPRG_12983 [Saprolegnia parasitica CBS 223.65]
MDTLAYLKHIEDTSRPETTMTETFVSVASTGAMYRVYVFLTADASKFSYSCAGLYLQNRLRANDKSIIVSFNMQCDRDDKVGKTVVVALKQVTEKFTFSARTLASAWTAVLATDYDPTKRAAADKTSALTTTTTMASDASP